MEPETAKQIAKHFREVYFGGNWTTSNLRDSLSDLSWEQAITPVHSFNTIATLAYHLHYYVRAVTRVLQGEPLNARDQDSFDHPPIRSREDWESLLEQMWKEASAFERLIGQLPESRLWDSLSEKKYGTYYRNLHGIIEHAHYHLGQIVLIRKWLLPVAEQ